MANPLTEEAHRAVVSAAAKWDRIVAAAPEMLKLLRDVRWGDPQWHDAKLALLERIDGKQP